VTGRRFSPDPPSKIGRLLAILLVSVVTEILRYYLHKRTDPMLLVVTGAIIANMGYHLWALPEDYKRSIVSALLGEGSMTPILGGLAEFAIAIAKALIAFAKVVISPA
jgi:hypothetical protein